MTLKKELEKEFKELYPVISAKQAKHKIKVRNGLCVVLCYEFRFLFEKKQHGYCIMNHNEMAVLMEWKRKRLNASGIERKNLKLRYLAELNYLRKGMSEAA